jgi:hypothetical protein
MKYRFSLLIVLFIVSVFLMNQNVQSQELDTQSIIDSLINPSTGLPNEIQEQISVEQIPRIPSPGQPVSIKITSFSTNLNAAQITWTQDGKPLNSGTGVTNNTVTAPSNGQSSTIRITITKTEGGTIIRTITLNPADVDLIYEAFTYAHPFYKGKKMFTSEAEVMFIAVPNFVDTNGRQIPENNLIYTWKINGSVQQEISGYGKSTFITKGTLIERPTNITVDVSATNSNLIATQTIRVSSQAPELILYENNPILGVIYEKAIEGSFLLERPQVDFEGIPYFFSANSKDDLNLSYAWSINGVRSLSKAPNENYMFLRNENNIDGRAIITARLSHLNNILQTASSRLELNFKKVDNTNNNEEFVF